MGISCVLPLTEKGKRLISIVKDKLNIYERPVTEAINGNDQLRFPKKKNLRIKFFRRIHKYIGVDAAYKLCVCDKIVKYKIRKIIR